MKKTVKKIAMSLIMVMLTNSLTGCFTTSLLESSDPSAILALPFMLALDFVTAPIQIIVYGVKKQEEKRRNERGDKLDGIDTFSAVSSPSAPELDSLSRRINSLPEEKIVPFTEAINSFSEEENSAMATAFNSLSEDEIASSIEALNSMSDENLIAVLNSFQHIRKNL